MKDRNENRPGYKKTKVGWIPEEWSLAKLIDLVELKRGFDLPHSRRCYGNIPVFASNGPVGMHDTSRARGPGILVGRSGSVGKVTLINEDYWPLNTTLYSKDLKGNDVYMYIIFLRL
ncbi:MAG: hypothetical protein JRF31_13360 [Deltaproteobacteria bacterium]|nr:hypothetical protein [Deltaproteobacteria bacterium]MBW2321786.1 hypothetical protein [Deltaproteobacteria bacterium]